LRTYIKRGASIGGGAVILPGLTIGEGAMIGAGSVVTKDVPSNTTVYGVSAKTT
jgi:acetyltransferase-like isoleucine patch superfamily enzyme